MVQILDCGGCAFQLCHKTVFVGHPTRHSAGITKMLTQTLDFLYAHKYLRYVQFLILFFGALRATRRKEENSEPTTVTGEKCCNDNYR